LSSPPTSTEFAYLRDWLEAACAIHLNDGKAYLVHSRLEPILDDLGCTSYTAFFQRHLQSADAALRTRVIDAMTTNETYWFRDDTPWLCFRDHLLPELVARRHAERSRPLRIWCAASSTGQEAYTIAMLVDAFCLASNRLRPSDVQIHASDISPTALQQAKSGRYGAVEMRRGFEGSWLSFRSRYFEQDGEGARVRDEYRSRVTFFPFNLKDSPETLPQFDLIFMRNVAIYFSTEFKQALFARLAGALHPQGALVIGATESLYGVSKALRAEQIRGQTIYRPA